MGFGETANHCFLQEKIPVILTAENLIFPDYLGLLTFNLTISAFIVWIKSCSLRGISIWRKSFVIAVLQLQLKITTLHPQRLKSTIFEIISDSGRLHKVLLELETYLETFKILQTKTELFSGQDLYLLVNCNINGTGVHLKDFKKRGKMFFTKPKSTKRIDM